MSSRNKAALYQLSDPHRETRGERQRRVARLAKMTDVELNRASEVLAAHKDDFADAFQFLTGAPYRR